MVTIAHQPPSALDGPIAVASIPPVGTVLGWSPLGPDMMSRWVVLKRSLTRDATGPVGYWAGPDDPDRYCDCLAVLNMRSLGRLNYAPVAAFISPGAAWSTWHRWHGNHLGHGWALEINQLAAIGDWSRIPPIPPRRHPLRPC